MPYLKRNFCKICISCSITLTEEHMFYYYKKQGYKASPLKRSLSQSLWGCLVYDFKQPFLVFQTTFHAFQYTFSPTRISTNVFKQQFSVFKHMYQTGPMFSDNKKYHSFQYSFKFNHIRFSRNYWSSQHRHKSK